MNKRVEKLVSEFSMLGIDAILIYNDLNVRYLSGYKGTDAYLYISKDRQVLLTDFRTMEQANKECPEYEIIDLMKLGFLPTVKKIAYEDSVKNLGFESSTVTYEQYKLLIAELDNINLVNTFDVVENIRMIKDNEEIKLIQKAVDISDNAFKFILGMLTPGITEREVAIELEFFMRRNGASRLSFDSIVASGINSSMPHAQPTDKMFGIGDFVTLDFGCVYEGYCSDMTRTVVIGKATKQQRKIYELVLDAQLEALTRIKAGMTGVEADKIARDVISNAGYGDYFGHGLGHGVGLYIHESPRLSFISKHKLSENMAVTVEPGIYLPNFGGVRIEDLVIVKKEGVFDLTSSPKELIEV